MGFRQEKAKKRFWSGRNNRPVRSTRQHARKRRDRRQSKTQRKDLIKKIFLFIIDDDLPLS